jgi:FtsP/CotA-like multicopper oxidase with cupredoxin domain
VTEGDHVRIKLVNKLPEPTTINWHGMQVPNDVAGIPDITQPAVQPGQSFTYEFTVGYPGTYMYHSMYDTMKQIGSGLYGAFIIDPKNPGSEAKYDHDYTMILSGFHVNGTMEDEEDYYTIDGRSYPDTPTIVVKKGETVRIRLINIDTLEYHTMHLHGMNFQVIAKDGQSSKNPQEMNTLSIGPGEIYDIAFKANAVGTWLFQCHILDHTMNAEDSMHMGGLVTTVKVVE